MLARVLDNSIDMGSTMQLDNELAHALVFTLIYKKRYFLKIGLH